MVDIDVTIEEPEAINVTLTGGGSGDVYGPSSSNDNAITTFDGTNGKVIKDSGLIVESGKIYQSGYPNSYIKFDDGAIEVWANGIQQALWN